MYMYYGPIVYLDGNKTTEERGIKYSRLTHMVERKSGENLNKHIDVMLLY